MKYILGTKEEMTQVFAESGVVTPATVVRVPANVVTQIRTQDRDGYTAVQLGAGTQKSRRINKPQSGHLKDKGSFRHLREFRVPADAGMPEEGAQAGVSAFQPGDDINVSGTSKGKGFQGVVKRHGFKGGPRTHGQKHTERAPGSIGATGPQRVFKGTRMAGRMGGERITVKNLKVLAVDPEEHLLIISGAIPGHRGSLIEIYGDGEMTWEESNNQQPASSAQPKPAESKEKEKSEPETDPKEDSGEKEKHEEESEKDSEKESEKANALPADKQASA